MMVYFLRHASAGQKRASAAGDEQRPLDEVGVSQSRHIGRLLAALEVEVDAIISSPLKRATQTAELVANAMGFEKKIELDAGMRPEATFESFRRLLEKHQRAQAIMVVGHNPSISEFLSLLLTRGDDDGVVEFKKGSVTKIEVNGTRSAILHWCVTPRIARALSEAPSSTPKAVRRQERS